MGLAQGRLDARQGIAQQASRRLIPAHLDLESGQHLLLQQGIGVIRAGIAFQAVDELGLDGNGLVAARKAIEHVDKIGGRIARCGIVDPQFGAEAIKRSAIGGCGLLCPPGIEQHRAEIGLGLQRFGMVGAELPGVKRQRPAHHRFGIDWLASEHQVERMVVKSARQDETVVAQRLGQRQNPGGGLGGTRIVLGGKGLRVDRAKAFDLGHERIGFRRIGRVLGSLARRHIRLGGLALQRACKSRQCHRRNHSPTMPDRRSDPWQCGSKWRLRSHRHP